MTVVVLSTPGDGNFTVPANITTLSLVQGIGGGQAGGVWVSPISPWSGGGGAYAEQTDVTVTPGQVIPYHVAAGAVWPNTGQEHPESGDNTWFGNADPENTACIIFAGGGTQTVALPVTTKGSTTFQGGGGHVNTLDFGPGTGGGGAGGPNGAGANGGSGGSPGPNGSGDGGQGDNGTGGAGGLDGASVGTAQNGQPGANGTEITGTVGAGGGGGGGANSSGIEAPTKGGDGGLYGAGGGIGTDQVFGGVGGNGAQGVIVLTFSPPSYRRTVNRMYALTTLAAPQPLIAGP